MEIIDYLRIIKKRIALLLIIPVVAAGLAAAYVLRSPQTYSATATVSTGTLVGGTGDYTGPQATNQFVAAFSSTATGPTVINAVSQKAGVGPTILRDGLTVAQSGASSNMTVTYQGTKKDSVQNVLKTEVESTLTAMFEPSFEAAKKQRDVAQEAVNNANAAVAAYAKKVGMADPQQAYQSTLNQVSSLEQERATLMANGNATAAQALSNPLKVANTRLARFGPILQGYADVTAVRSAAESDYTAAQAEYRQAQSQLESATATNTTYISATVTDSRTSTLLTLVLPVFAAGFLLAFVIAIGLEMLGNAKRGASGEGRHSEGSAEPAPAAGPQPETAPVAAMTATAADPAETDEPGEPDDDDADEAEAIDEAPEPAMAAMVPTELADDVDAQSMSGAEGPERAAEAPDLLPQRRRARVFSGRSPAPAPATEAAGSR